MMQNFNHAVLGRTKKGGFFTSLGIAIALGSGAGVAGANLLTNRRKSTPAPAAPATPAAPISKELPAQAKETASAAALKQRRARTKTNVTGPRGLLTQPRTEKKDLLGQ